MNRTWRTIAACFLANAALFSAELKPFGILGQSQGEDREPLTAVSCGSAVNDPDGNVWFVNGRGVYLLAKGQRSAELLQKRGKFRFRKIASGPSGAVDEVAEKEDQIRRFGVDFPDDPLQMRSAPGRAEVQIAQHDDFHSVETPRPSGDSHFGAAKCQQIRFDEERPQQTAADQKNQDGGNGGGFVFPWDFHAIKYTRKRNFQIFWHAFCYSIS